MDYNTRLNLGTAVELAITAALVFRIRRFMLWIAMAVGVMAGLASVVTTGDSNYVSGVVMGLLVGGFNSGLFDGFKGIGG